ncbi:hypothetical protein ES707_04218 [subsurface metagenome]
MKRKLAKLEKTPLQRQAIYQEQASKNEKLAKLEKTPLQRQAIYQEHASKNKKLVKLEKMLLEGKKGEKGRKRRGNGPRKGGTARFGGRDGAGV